VWKFRYLLSLIPFLAAISPASAMCLDNDAACEVELGTYHIQRPADVEGQVPAVLFIHGYGGTGMGVMRNSGMIDAILARGYAVISPDGMPMDGQNGRSWSFNPLFAMRRDEASFIQSVRDDAGQNHGIDVDQILMAGFSIGGSLTSYLACSTPDAFAAYAPISGGFWRPQPEECAGTVRLFHTHGWTDGTVPLEGRVLRNAELDGVSVEVAQGDIFRTMEIWRSTNNCTQYRADDFAIEGYYWRRSWERCEDGSALELALFPGGHIIPQGWAKMVLDWFEAL
jgi:polyhydroxybutyrate depolymerase